MTILQSYLHANRCVHEEYEGIALEVLEGAVPTELHGTLFRNGNGRFIHQGVTYKHLFDGDGMVSAYTFRDGRVYYRNRYVYTREFREEERAGRMLYRSFGTNLPGGMRRNFLRMRFKNAANTSVVYHGGKLLALWEGGWPHALDPATLTTIGRYDYDGVLQNDFSTLDRLITPELPFSAHPRRHPDTGVLYNFGTAAGSSQRLVLYRVEPDGRAAISRAIPLDELSFTHDFVLTEAGEQVFFLLPVAFDLLRSFTGLLPPVDAMRSAPSRPTRILVVDGDRTEEYTTDFCFIFHFANGYRRADGALVIDAFTLPDFPDTLDMRRGFDGQAEEAPEAQLTRFILHPGRREAERKTLSALPGEFPMINRAYTGKPYRYVYQIAEDPARGRALTHGYAKYDLETDRHLLLDLYPQLPGEPLFVPRPGATAEDDGWLLALTYDPDSTRTFFHIYDAATLTSVARLRLPHNIPLGFHGCWTEEVW